MGSKTIISAGHFHFFHRTAPIMAERKGYFREEGLSDVAIVAPGEDELAMENLKAGKVDFILDARPSVPLSENSKGADVYIIGSMVTGLPTSLHGAKGIERVEDLKGKRVGLVHTGGGREALWVKDLLRRHGLVPGKDVTFIFPIGYPSLHQQAPRLDRGDYQAVLIAYQHSDDAVKAGYARLAQRADECPDYPDRVVVSTGSMIAQHPETVKAFLKGLIRGYRFTKRKENWPEIVKMVESYKWEDDLGWEGFDRSELDGQLATVKYLSSDGSVNTNALEVVITQAKSLGMLPEAFTIDQGIRLAFVEQAAKELNQKYGPMGYE